MPSQFVSAKLRSGTSLGSVTWHSHPFDVPARGALRSPSRSTYDALHAHPHIAAAHMAPALARIGHAMPQPPQCIALVLKSNIGTCMHVYMPSVLAHVSIVHGLGSAQSGGALRTQTKRAASQLHVPMHASTLSRAHVVSPSSHGSDRTQPVLGSQYCWSGHIVSTGLCTHAPRSASQRSVVHDTMSSQRSRPPTTTQRPKMQRCAFIHRSGAVHSSSWWHRRPVAPSPPSPPAASSRVASRTPVSLLLPSPRGITPPSPSTVLPAAQAAIKTEHVTTIHAACRMFVEPPSW